MSKDVSKRPIFDGHQMAARDVMMKHLDARLAELRATNDKSSTEEKTEHIRGRIAEIKKLQGQLVPKIPQTTRT